jgi:hypothetical protein
MEKGTKFSSAGDLIGVVQKIHEFEKVGAIFARLEPSLVQGKSRHAASSRATLMPNTNTRAPILPSFLRR